MNKVKHILYYLFIFIYIYYILFVICIIYIFFWHFSTKGILTLEYLDRQLADINEGKYNGIIEKNTRMLNLISYFNNFLNFSVLNKNIWTIYLGFIN